MGFLLELALILAATKAAGELSVRLGQPSVLGKLLVGILLGPSLLGWLHPNELIFELSEVGVVLLMFIAGLETEIGQLRRSAFASTLVAIGGVVLPLAAGFGFAELLGLSGAGALFFGVILTATSVSISVQTLRELNRLRTEEGATILGAAVLDDILGVLLLAVALAMAVGGDLSLGELVGWKIVYVALAIPAGFYVLPWLLRQAGRLRVTVPLLTGALAVCFLYAYFADRVGLANIIGAYLAGLLINLRVPQKQAIMEQAETVAYSLFVPFFFVSIGLRAELGGIASELGLAAFLSLIAILTKVVGAGLGTRLSGLGWHSSLGIGAGMVSRGEVALIVATIGLNAGIVDEATYTMIVLVVLVTTVATPPLLKLIFGPPAEARGEARLGDSLQEG